MRGEATVNDCTYVLRDYVNRLSDEIELLANAVNEKGQNDESMKALQENIGRLNAELEEVFRGAF